jgi:hypothetical protein
LERQAQRRENKENSDDQLDESDEGYDDDPDDSDDLEDEWNEHCHDDEIREAVQDAEEQHEGMIYAREQA